MALGDIRINSNSIENGTREIKLYVIVEICDPGDRRIHFKFRIRGSEKPVCLLDCKYEDGVFIYKCLENYGKLWHMPFAAKLYAGQLLPGGASGENISMLIDMFLK